MLIISSHYRGNNTPYRNVRQNWTKWGGTNRLPFTLSLETKAVGNNARVAVFEAWLDLQFLLSLRVTYKEDMFIKKVKATAVIYKETLAHM